MLMVTRYSPMRGDRQSRDGIEAVRGYESCKSKDIRQSHRDVSKDGG